MTQVEFEKQTLGTKVGDGQCVAFVRTYLNRVKGLPWNAVPSGSDAEEWWANAPSSKFRKITGGIPYEGAILCLRVGEFGHVAVVRKGATAESIPVVEANWAVKLHVTYGRHRNRNIRWLFPR
jgi:surface antigen